MKRKDFLEALKDNNIKDFEIIEDNEIDKLLVIVKSQSDKNFVENYLYENLHLGIQYQVILKG